MNAKRTAGFTLLELMITVFVAAILLAFGVPSFIEFQRNNAIAAAANDLVSATLAARAEAIKLQVPVTLCASANPMAANPVCSPTGAGANGGFFVWVDENGNVDANGVPIINDPSDGDAVRDAGERVLLVRPAPGLPINVFANTGVVSYGANGFRRFTIAGLAVQPPVIDVLYCDDRGNRGTASGSTARVVRIDRAGRGQTLRDVDEVTPVIGTIPGAVCP
jgi:prepilin-type N-terminal cleavage/methylation domain-containing protein